MLHMEHKNYKLEIILKLINEKNHIREIAKLLHTNHMIIVRRMNELMKENVVDFEEKGKNKIFFLKKSIEAKNYVLISEIYRLTILLEKYPFLRKLIQKIQLDKRIKLAILFGSHSKGIARKNSDIDLYIESSSKELKKDLLKIDSRLSLKMGKYDSKNILIKEIGRNHVILKGFEEFYAKNGFFD
jgi:predicted nucleotidyltransferase